MNENYYISLMNILSKSAIFMLFGRSYLFRTIRVWGLLLW